MSIDHRRGAAYAPGELIEYVRAGWDLDQDIRTYVEVVHRLSDLGAVCTHAGHGVSREGFDAEWRGVDLLTVEGDMVNRCEVFDDADLDAAIARFDQLSRPAPRLENAASQANERFLACFAARDWDAMAEILAVDHYSDDRRRVVGAGTRHGRDAEIETCGWSPISGHENHGRRHRDPRRAPRLGRGRFSALTRQPRVPRDLLGIVEIDVDERVAAFLVFDLDDIEAAIAELDTRYVAGEAAAHAHTWSVIAGNYAAVNRHELAATTPDWMNIDHRRETASGPAT